MLQTLRHFSLSSFSPDQLSGTTNTEVLPRTSSPLYSAPNCSVNALVCDRCVP